MNDKKTIKIFPIILFTILLNPLFSQNNSQKIEWREWNVKAFEQARKQDKMILVDIGMEGCTACRWMDEDTYTNSDVVKRVNENFIAIQVDSEARPDIGERYSDWAWPATIFMTAEAVQVLALRGNKRPRNFIPILNELIENKQNNALLPDENVPYTSLSHTDTTDLMRIRDRVRQQLDNYFDDEKGGWGLQRKSLYSYAPIFQLLLRYQSEGNQQAREDALKTIRGMTKQLDPLWGGIFVATINDWDLIIPEKRSGKQAAALFVFAEAYKLTTEPLFLDAAMNIDRYMQNFMMSDNGTFFTSQEDDAPQLRANMDARNYYKLSSDARRRSYGIPPIDHAIYTDLNSMLISAYVRFYEATNDGKYIKIAARAASALIHERMQNNEGWVLHIGSSPELDKDKRMRKQPQEKRLYLRPQAYFGQALLDLYRASAQQHWLDRAHKLGSNLLMTLEDKKLGGFYASQASGVDNILPKRKPMEDNAVVARFLYELSVYTKNEQFRHSAENAIRAVSATDIVQRDGKIIGNLAVVLEILTSGYVEFSVVGQSDAPDAQALFKAAQEIYEPRKILHFEKPGRYPDQGQAALFICNENACSVPITDINDVALQAAKFRKTGSTLRQP